MNIEKWRKMKKIIVSMLIFLSIPMVKTLAAQQPLVPPQNQRGLFNFFANGSWKSQNVNLLNHNATIEQHLVREFNNHQWAPRLNSDIHIDLAIQNLNNISSYYQKHHYDPRSLSYTLENYDSPRQWMRKLNLRELCRFKEFFDNNHNLINNANYATDDLVKARAISGVFWKVDTTNGRFAEKVFSGMLVAGQNLNRQDYQVYTCLHGFDGGNATNNVAYYFVPYGVDVNEDPQDDEYVTRRGLRVISVRHFRPVHNHLGGTNINIDSPFFNHNSNDMNVNQLYSQRDYAVATVDAATADLTRNQMQMALNNPNIQQEGRLGLEQILNIRSRLLLHLPEIHNNLPTLNNDNGDLAAIDNTQNFDPDNERLFVIGLASRPYVALDNTDLLVATTLRNQGAVNQPRRSFRDDENTKVPQHIGSIVQEAVSSLATYPGISGGAILRCRLAENPPHKRCMIVGTNWGGERIFNNNNQIEGFGSIINTIP